MNITDKLRIEVRGLRVQEESGIEIEKKMKIC